MTFPSFATGDVLTAADMNAVGLWLVKTQTVGTAVASVTVNNAFSSSYKNYKIIWNAGLGSGFADLALSLGGITTGYYGGQFGASYVTGNYGGRGVNNAASWLYAGSCNSSFAFFHCDVIAPQAAERKLCHGYCSYYGAAFAYSMFTGEVTSTAQATSFTITPSAGTLTGGTIYVYGYKP